MTPRSRERVLIVEDDPGMRRAVERTLSPVYETVVVATVADALEQLGEQRIHAALVDIELPDGDGYALCSSIRVSSPETDVILMTGSISQTDEKLYRALEEDAFYVLFKPFERRVLLALLERCLRLQRERREKELHAYALAADLDRARLFQASLMPQAPLAHAGWRLEGRFLPCDALGGDFFVYQEDRRGDVVLAVADVVGHGVGAAMYAGMLRSILDAARRRDPQPGKVVGEIVAGADFFQGSLYATLFYAQLLGDGRLIYINAGHPPAYVLRASGELVSLDASGIFITTSFPALRREVRELRLEDGDRLLAYSDGLSEAMNAAGDELGRDGVTAALSAARELPLDAALDTILVRLGEHRAGRPLEDDVTLLLVERTGNGSGVEGAGLA